MSDASTEIGVNDGDFSMEPTVTEWRAERVGGHKSAKAQSVDWDNPDFTHPDREMVEHWVLHQQMRDPRVIFEIFEIETTLRATI